jgi:transcriptional regulator with XRE-family HTH domain
VSKTTSDNSIGNRLKLLRNELKLNQKEISERLKITRAYWSALELGNRELTGNIIRALIAEFDISADWLLGGNRTMFLSNNPADQKEVEFESEAHIYYRQIVAVVELIEKLMGSNPEYDIYLTQIRDVLKLADHGKTRAIKRQNFKTLSEALSKDFMNLFDQYFMMNNQSERTKKFNTYTFEPSRNFERVKLEQ